MSGAADVGIVIRPAIGADETAIMAVWAANGDEIPEGGGIDILTPY